MIRGHTSLSPSGPNTKLEPTNAKSSSRLIARAERLEHRLAGGGLEHEQREDHLQRQAPGDRPPIDRAPVRRQRVGDRQDDDQADERLQPAAGRRTGAMSATTAAPRRPRRRAPSTSRASYGARGGGTRRRVGVDSLGHQSSLST